MRRVALLCHHDGGVVVGVEGVDGVRAEDALGVGEAPVEADAYFACLVGRGGREG